MADSSTAPASDHVAAVAELQTQLSDLLDKARQAILHTADRVSPGMLPPAYKVFSTVVRRGPITPSQLADAIAMDRGQLSRMLRELDDLGLIERAADPDDKRSSTLSATPLGIERLHAAQGPEGSQLAAALTDWGVNDIRTLTRLLGALSTGEPPRSS